MLMQRRGTNKNRTRFQKNIIAFTVGAAIGAANVQAADDTRGFLRGTATDIDGQPIADVKVTITNEARGTSRTAITDSKGNYRVPALPTGTYSLTAEQDGKTFATASEIAVNLGTKTTFNLGVSGLEETLVLGTQTNLDTSSAVKDTVFNVGELASRVPIPRNITAVALLAPTATAADVSFAAANHDIGTISLGGASVAENACYINGMNTTNFRNGLGCTQLPFEFYEQIQVKNGGYNAEFGRSIGGVLNATTKSGSNEFHFGANIYWQPEGLTDTSPNTYVNQNKYDKRERIEGDLWASGAIVQDRLFFYALVTPNKKHWEDAGGGTQRVSDWDDFFWGLKLDLIIADGHTLEYTGFDDYREEHEDTYEFIDESRRGDYIGTTAYKRGGENHILKYTGVINDMWTVSALYGTNEYARSDVGSTDINPVVIDERSGTAQNIGAWANSQPSTLNDTREALRLDVDLFLGDHNIRFGYDQEVNTAEELTRYSGGVYYRYYSVTDSNYEDTNDGNGVPLLAGDDYLRVRTYLNDGSFETISSSFYVQDEWAMGDRTTLHLGLRSDTFDNRNAQGETFIKIENQIAPRLGISFDPTGNDQSRIYANIGRYFLPIAANTNIRMAGAEFFTAEYYRLNGLNADDTPIYDTGSEFDNVVYSDGEVPDTSEILNTAIKPMFQDEFIVGYDWTMGDWNLGVKGIYRELGSTIEDIAVDAALNRYVENATGEQDFAGGFDYYVLTNPGFDVKFSVDIDHDGDFDPVTLKAADLGYPKASRVYKAFEFTYERVWDEKWMLQGSLVFATSRGNHEGYVKSDNGQDDAGILTSFDQPGLVHGMNGPLPNERKWAFKAFGAYKFDFGMTMGLNLLAQDGRQKNCIGVVPSDIDPHASAYGAAGLYCDGNLVQRGSLGTTSDIINIDFQAMYEFDVANGSLIARADIFNLFNFSEEIEVRELGETGGGAPDPNFGKPSSYQAPRSVRFSLSYKY